MKLTIIGSGTFIPDKRANACYLIESENKKLILDMGRGAISNLIKAKIDLYELNHIFISHVHADHLSELISLIALFLDSPNKERLYPSMLKIYGPKGIKESIDKILEAHKIKEHKNLERINTIELEDKQIIKIDNIIIKTIYVTHNIEMKATSYRVEENNKIFAYSGDTTDCKEIRITCKDANVALLESTLPKKICPKTHISGEEAGKIASESNVKHLVLTHIAKIYLKQAVNDANKYFNRKITIARDLLSIDI